VTQFVTEAAQQSERDRQSHVSDWRQSLLSRNTLLVLAVAVVAAIVRFWHFSSLGYTHWDEFYFVADGDIVSRLWPRGLGQIDWQATPFVPYTDGTLIHFLGSNNWIPLAISASYGTLSAVALYFLGSRLFGNAVGLIAAALLATAEFSVMYSRMALADATFNFWLIASVLFIWLGFTRGQMRFWVLAGVCAGILLNTKYNGLFPPILAVTWLIAEFAVDAIVRGRRFVRVALSEYLPRAAGTALMVALAIVMFTPWLVRLAHNPGLHAFLGGQSHFFAVKTPPEFIFQYYWLFTSPPTVVLAIAGIAVGIIRFTRADRLLLIYTAGWLIALSLFGAYPREALSLLPAVAIWVGRATLELWNLLRTLRKLPDIPAAGAAAACLAVVLLSQMIPLSHMLSLRTQGYADAAALTDRYQSSGGMLFVRTQPVAFLYLHRYPYYVATKSSIQALADNTPNVYFMTDHTLTSHPDLMDFFQLNKDRLHVIEKVPNQLYPETILLPATEYGLSHLDDPPVVFRYILIWHATGPLLYPSSWAS
jgi:4-amino-4-deoxy-L-arabinose transferase-like glycosyltransferase